MKKIFFILSLFLTSFAYSQNPVGVPTQITGRWLSGKGYISSDSGFFSRFRDTANKPLSGYWNWALASGDTIPYFYANGKYYKIQGGSSGPVNTRFSVTKGTGDSLQLVGDESTPIPGHSYSASVLNSTRGWNPSRESLYGQLYNNNSWANLSGFTVNGGNFSVSSSKILAQGGAGNFTQTLDFNPFTMLPVWKITALVRIGTKDATSYGFGLGIRSYNSFGLSNVTGRFLMYTGTDNGKVIINTGTGNTQAAISASALTFSVNDYIMLTVEMTNGLITVSAYNVTTNSSYISTSYSYTGTTPYMPNTGRFSVYSLGGNFTVDSLAISSNTARFAPAVIIGDSKSQLYNATSVSGVWGSILNNNVHSTVIHAGGFDKTLEVSAAISEIKALKGMQYIMAIGSNDIRTGVDSLTYCTRYDSVVAAIQGSGGKVLHTTLFYETGVNQMPLINHIRQVYPSTDIIETYAKTAAFPGFLSGDGVHPTPEGQKYIAQIVLESYKVYGNGASYSSSQSFSGTNNYFTKFSGNTIVDAPMYDDGNYINITRPNIELINTTSLGYSWNKTNAGSDNKIWQNYIDNNKWYVRTVNDARSAGFNIMVATRNGNDLDSLNLSGGGTSGMSIRKNGLARIYNPLMKGTGVEGIVQDRAWVAPDGNVETYSFGGIAHIQGINNARNAGYPLRVGGGYLSLGWISAPGVYNESALFTSTGIGLGVPTPSSVLHIKAGTATASTAPLKFTAGTILTVAESGVLETDGGNNIFYTNATAVRGRLQQNRTLTSAAGTLSITDNYNHYVFTGSTSTWTLPAVSGTANVIYYIKNRGSGVLTINTTSGNEIYDTAAVNTLAVSAGSALVLFSDGTYYNVE